MEVSGISTNIYPTTTTSSVTRVVEPTPPPSGGKIGFSASITSPQGKIGFTPPSDGKIGGAVDVQA
jgi:hypothetical protein